MTPLNQLKNHQHDMMPRRMFGVASVEETNQEKVDPLTFIQIVHQCHNQMSSKNLETEPFQELKKNQNN